LTGFSNTYKAQPPKEKTRPKADRLQTGAEQQYLSYILLTIAAASPNPMLANLSARMELQ